MVSITSHSQLYCLISANCDIQNRINCTIFVFVTRVVIPHVTGTIVSTVSSYSNFQKSRCLNDSKSE